MSEQSQGNNRKQLGCRVSISSLAVSFFQTWKLPSLVVSASMQCVTLQTKDK